MNERTEMTPPFPSDQLRPAERDRHKGATSAADPNSAQARNARAARRSYGCAAAKRGHGGPATRARLWMCVSADDWTVRATATAIAHHCNYSSFYLYLYQYELLARDVRACRRPGRRDHRSHLGLPEGVNTREKLPAALYYCWCAQLDGR